MSTFSKKLLNQAFYLIAEHSQESQALINKYSKDDESSHADYLFALVSHFKISNYLPIALLHQLEYLAELQEREDQALNIENTLVYAAIIQASSRHTKFNDFFTSNFK